MVIYHVDQKSINIMLYCRHPSHFISSVSPCITKTIFFCKKDLYLTFPFSRSTIIVSGGKDCRLQFTDLRTSNCQSMLVAIESHPILSLCLSPDLTMVWVGTTDSTI